MIFGPELLGITCVRNIILKLLLKARARLEMREKASQQDAQDVIEIMKYSLLDTFSDDFGNLDFQRSQHGSGMSSRAQVKLCLFRYKSGISIHCECLKAKTTITSN